MVDRAMKREPAAMGTSPYGDWDTMLGTLTAQLAKGPFLLGDRFPTSPASRLVRPPRVRRESTLNSPANRQAD